jgi:hypothetical protein
MAAVTLDPENAALSIKRRLETIDACTAYLREVTARYAGFAPFRAELERLGIKDAVDALTDGGS